MRRNPPHNELSTGHRLESLATASVGSRELPGTELLEERLKRWGLRPDDPAADEVRRRLTRIQLSVGDQLSLLDTAERIAEAQKAKAAWNPKAKASQYLNLCKIVTAAARLSKEISEVFSPPWTAERARLGLVVAELAAFIEGILAGTMVVDKNASVSLAVSTARTMKLRRPPKGPVYWELLQDLTWLASGRTAGRISERSVRRYLEDQRMSRSPARAYWRRNFKLIQEAVRLNLSETTASSKLVYGLRGEAPPPEDGDASGRQLEAIEAFEEIARRYLKTPLPPNSTRGLRP